MADATIFSANKTRRPSATFKLTALLVVPTTAAVFFLRHLLTDPEQGVAWESYAGLALSLAGVLLAAFIYRHQSQQSHQQEQTLVKVESISTENKSLLMELEIVHTESARILSAVQAQSADQTAMLEELTLIAETTRATAQAAGLTSGVVGNAKPDMYSRDQVPLWVLGDLISKWQEPATAGERWSVGQLTGAFRFANAAGKFNGTKWFVVFRDRTGTTQVWSVYRGKGGVNNASVERIGLPSD